MEQLNAVSKTPEPGTLEMDSSLGKGGQFSGVIWKYCVGVVVAVCMSFIVKAQPVINSFSPSSTLVGVTVNIAGSGFSTTAANNTVYFGPVKAKVNGSTATSINVTVPAGAGYAPITVTTGGLTAQSKGLFTPIFTTCSSVLGTTPFSSSATSPSSATGTRINTADIDGDGKPDLVTFNNFSVNVFLNTTITSGGDITFATKYSLDLQAGTTSHQHYGAVVSDLDGDGKLDIAFVNSTASRVLIYRNQSTTGNIDFSAATVYTGFSGPLGLTSGDFNGDGKIDLAVVNASSVKFLRNASTSGTISFVDEGTPVTTGSGPFHISSADFDGDGKADLAVSNSTSNTISFFRNTFAGVAGTDPISFGNGLQIVAGANPQGMVIGDLDGDGVVDIALVNSAATGLVSFMRNTSSIGSISFTRTTLTPSGGSLNLAGRVALTDVDGDTRPDVIVGSAASAIYCFKNISAVGGGAITFDNTPVAVSTGVANGQPVGVCVGDFNNDARPDLADVNAGSANVDVFVNKISKVVVNTMTPLTGTQGTVITLIGTGLGCVEKVTIGGVAATFGSADENTVKITAGTGNTGNVVLVTGTGSQYFGPKFTFVVPPTNFSYAAKSADTTISVLYGTESFTNSPVITDGGGGIVYNIDSGSVVGININALTGQIGWIPSLAVGEYRLKVKAENSAGSIVAYMTLKVVPDVPKDLAYFSSPYGATYSFAGSTGSTVSGDVWVDWKGQTGVFSINAMSPASTGISINPANGQITWNSSVAVATYNITVWATNDAGHAATTIQLKVLPQVPDNLSYPAPNPLTIKYGNAGGVNISSSMSWHGENGAFAMTGTGIPSGITINTSTGRISWNNTVPAGGPYVMQVTATNSAGTSTATTFTLTVEAEAPTNLVYASPVNGDFGSAGATAAPSVNWHGSTVTYSLTNAAALPAGITIESATGIVHWPSTLDVGVYTIKVIGQNAIGASNEASFDLNIRALTPSGMAYPASVTIPFATAGNLDFTTAPNWNGNTGTFSINNAASLPAGITIDPTTGKITWDNTLAVANYSVQVRATNSRSYQQVTVTLQVVAEAPVGFNYTPASYSADYGTADSIPNMPNIDWRGNIGTFSIVSVSPVPATGSIGVTPTGKISWTAALAVSAIPYTVTVRATNSKGNLTTTFALTINAKAPEAPVYNPLFKNTQVGGTGSSGTATVSNWNGETGTFELSGTYPAGITLNATTGVISWDNSLAVGGYDVLVKAKNSMGSSAEGKFTINITALAPTEFYYNDNGETATYSVAGSSRAPVATLGGGTGTYTIETSGVSSEISINSTTGVISWTGNLPIGTIPAFTVKVSNGTGSLTTSFTLKVVAGAPKNLTYVPAGITIPYGTAGSSNAPATINWYGENGTFSISNAPAGVTINATTGVISWSSAVAVGNHVMTVSATNNQAPAATATYTLKVTGSAPDGLKYAPDSIRIDAGVGGQSAKPDINWNGETGTFEITNKDTLSPGITIDADGIIHWTDLVLPKKNYVRVVATNSSGHTDTAIFVLYIVPADPALTYNPPFTAIMVGTKGQSAPPTFKLNGTDSTIYTFALANSSAYPPGIVTIDKVTGTLHFDATTVTSPVTYTINIVLANSDSRPAVFLDYKLYIGNVPTNLVYKTKGYTMLEGSTLTSVTPTINWNNVTGVFKISGEPAGVSIDDNSGVITFGPTVPAGVYKFTVKGESSLGSSNEVEIELEVIAKADAVISGGSTICENTEASLAVNLTGTAPFSFAYTDGTTTQTVSNIADKVYTLKVKPTTTTTYTITSVSDANSEDNPVTAGTDKTTVTVLPAPVAGIQPANVCLGSTATLTATAGVGYVYTWSNGGTGLTTTVNASGNYTVTVTDGNSCSTTSAPLNVKLNTIPTAKLNKPSNTLICEGSAKPLTATGGTSYNWYRNGALINDSTKFTYYASAEGSYTVDAVSAEGCTTKASDVVVLQFAKKPKADFTYDTYCRDVEINFTNNSDEGGGEILYKWVFDADNASTEKEPVFAYSTAGAKTIKLTATSKVCPDLSDVKTVNLTIEEPAPSQRYEAVNGITGRSVTLKAQAKGDTYLWTSKDGLNTGLSDVSAEQPTLRVTKGDEYTLKISTKAGCVTVDTQQVRIFSGAQIFVPKAFTPNNDGVNDKLYPIPVGIPQITYFRVFNRWGVLMYETKQAGTPGNGVGWDGNYKGKAQPFDTYTWVAEGIDLDGKPVKLSGNSVLLR